MTNNIPPSPEPSGKSPTYLPREEVDEILEKALRIMGFRILAFRGEAVDGNFLGIDLISADGTMYSTILSSAIATQLVSGLARTLSMYPKDDPSEKN